MKALTHDFIVGRALSEAFRHTAAAIAEASRGALDPDGVTLILPPPHTGSDLAFRCFELARSWKRNPAEIAREMAQELRGDEVVARYVAAGPYLNIELERAGLLPKILREAEEEGADFGRCRKQAEDVVMMEYISPNTNKPLHLGHLRNGILGRAVGHLVAAQGARVALTSIVNDRGIHIAKSMLAYERWGEGKTPESAGIKGDHFVGALYVRYSQALDEEKDAWFQENLGMGLKDFKKLPEKEKKEGERRFQDHSELTAATREILQKWEAGDRETRALWKKMNGWVYEGFDETYRRFGLRFDQHFYESEIYQGGKEIIEDALSRDIFKRAPNGAVLAPLSEHSKLQDKAVLRADGTGLYITQDINLATIKFKEFGLTRSIYCVGSEQDYYLKQLFATMKLLGFPWADGLFHLSYGMVSLPDGKMKSREGNVVDADDLLDTMKELAQKEILERHPDLAGEALERRGEAIALAAIVFQLLIVSRESPILFDKEKAVRFEGKTGPYLQYAYARVSSILRKAGEWRRPETLAIGDDMEWRIAFQILLFPTVLADAAEEYDPMRLASYLFELAQTLSSFLDDHPVLTSQASVRDSRLALLAAFRTVLGNGLRMLSIEPLDEM